MDDVDAPPRVKPAQDNRPWRMLNGKEKWLRAKPQVIAAVLLFHVVGVVLQALPAVSGGMNRKAWKDQTAQAEFHQWADLARSVGWNTTDENFEEFLWDSAHVLMDTRKVILKPWRKYLRATGAQQGWRMFVAPHRYPSWLVVEVEFPTADGKKEWREMYRSRSSEKDYLRTQLDYHRMRKYTFLTSWKHRRRAYKDLRDFFARRAAVDFPEATRLRIFHVSRRTMTPAEMGRGEVPESTTKNRMTVSLKTYRDQLAKKKAKQAAKEATRGKAP